MTSKEQLEILNILKSKRVSIGFIQLLIDYKAGGVNEYNDYINLKTETRLTKSEYNKIKEWLKNEY